MDGLALARAGELEVGRELVSGTCIQRHCVLLNLNVDTYVSRVHTPSTGEAAGVPT